MELKRLYIKQFGGLHEREIVFTSGCNVLFGANETGKSTIMACIRFLFYGAKFKKETGQLSWKEKYLPWQGGPMEAEVEFCADGKDFLLTRRVGARTGKTPEATLLCKTTGEQLSAEHIGQTLLGLSDEGFTRTMFLSALTARIGADKEGELAARMSNLAESGAEEASFHQLDAALKEQIAELTSARRTGAVIPGLERRMEELQNQLERATGAAEQMRQLSDAKAQAQAEYAACSKEKQHWKQLQQSAAMAKAAEAFRTAIDAQNAAKAQAEAARQDWESIPLDGAEAAACITAEEEAVLLRDDGQRLADLHTRALLLEDKRKNAKWLMIAGIVLAAAFAVGGFFMPALFAGTIAGAVLAVFGIVRGNNLRAEQERYDRQEKELQQDKAEILNRYGLSSIEAYLHHKQEYTSRKAQKENAAYRMQLAEDALAEKNAAVEEWTAEIVNRYGSVDAVAEARPVEGGENAEEHLKQADERLLALTAAAARAEEALESVRRDAISPALVQEELDENRELLAEARRQLAAAELAKEVLEEAYETLKSNFAPVLAQKTAEIFARLTGGKYGELLVSEGFDVRIKNEIGYTDIRNFSAGTMEQLYFSLRLGIIETIGVNCPLFLDDPFVLYDDDRVLPAMAFLKEFAQHRQVLLCTCHRRDVQAAGGSVITL